MDTNKIEITIKNYSFIFDTQLILHFQLRPVKSTKNKAKKEHRKNTKTQLKSMR